MRLILFISAILACAVTVVLAAETRSQTRTQIKAQTKTKTANPSTSTSTSKSDLSKTSNRKSVTPTATPESKVLTCDNYTMPASYEPEVPFKLRVKPRDGTFFLKLFGEGTQNYQCGPVNGTNGWTLVEPKAFLHLIPYRNSTIVGSHYFQPDNKGGKATWEANSQGCGQVTTKITDQVLAQDPDRDIAYLRTEMTSAVGTGPLAQTKYVLRVNTFNGAPPKASECGTAKYPIGATYASDYVANYAFYKAPDARRL